MQKQNVRIYQQFSVWHILLVSPLFIATIYAVFNRTLGDYVVNSAITALAMAAAIIMNFAYEWIKSARPKPAIPFRAIFLSFFAIVLVSPLYYGVVVALKDLYLFLLGPASGRTPTVFLTAILTLGLGIGLFIFRLKARTYYGLTEIMVGVTVAIYRVTTTSETGILASADLYLAVLTAGIYLVVRGLDNMHQGLEKEPDSLLARMIRGKYLRQTAIEVTIEPKKD